MGQTRFPRDLCDELFADYPLAVRAGRKNTTTICSMVLMLLEDDGEAFYVLSCDDGEGRPSYLLRQWHTIAAVNVVDDSDPDAVRIATSVVTRGVPIPEHGSLFGWKPADAVTALIPIYSDATAGAPEPSWAVMPGAGVPQDRWPPFTGERVFGAWFWDHHSDGNIISLADLIAETEGAVFWVDTEKLFGSGCCVVEHDIGSPQGYRLPADRYVYHEALQGGMHIPPASALLASGSKIDLGPRFWYEGSASIS